MRREKILPQMGTLIADVPYGFKAIPQYLLERIPEFVVEQLTLEP